MRGAGRGNVGGEGCEGAMEKLEVVSMVVVVAVLGAVAAGASLAVDVLVHELQHEGGWGHKHIRGGA